jgi:peptide/nickel transport system substrate-binding protein
MAFIKKILNALTKKERIMLITSVSFIVVSAISIAIISLVKTAAIVPTTGGNYKEGMIGQPEYINPVTANSEVDRSLVRMIYSNIYDIADSITVSSDTKIWDIRLKNGINWQDGQKLTSDDVIFTIQEIQNKDSDSPLFNNWAGVSVNRVSELELTLSIATPYIFFGDNLKNLYILPKHIFAGIPPANWRLSDYNLKPVGSGPYLFDSYKQLQNGFITEYNLKSWNSYFGQKPLINNFHFEFFNDKNSIIGSFNNAQIDGLGGISPSEISEIIRPYNLFQYRTSGYYAIFLNQTKNQALNDPIVREALSIAIDKNDIIKSVMNGFAKVENGPIPEDAAYYSPVQIPTSTASTSLDFAKSLLDQDSWVTQSDGSRAKTIKKSSVPLSINITVPNVDFLVQIVDIIKTDWQNLGVNVTISLDSPEDIASVIIPGRTYDGLLFGNVLGNSSDLYSFWNSSQSVDPGLNLAMYSNSKVDALLEKIRRTQDSNLITQYFIKVQNMITNDNPAIFIYSPDYLYVANKNIQGISTPILSDTADRFRDVPNWYLNTTIILK